jgi:hypothetical protein
VKRVKWSSVWARVNWSKVQARLFRLGLRSLWWSAPRRLRPSAGV